MMASGYFRFKKQNVGKGVRKESLPNEGFNMETRTNERIDNKTSSPRKGILTDRRISERNVSNKTKFISTTRKVVIVQPVEMKDREIHAPSNNISDQERIKEMKYRKMSFSQIVLSVMSEEKNQTDNSVDLPWTKLRITKLMLKVVMFIAFGLIASKFSIQFYQEYRSEPTFSSLEIMFNDTISLPNATLCLPLFPGELDRTRRTNVFDSATSAMHNAYIIAYFNQKNLTKEYFMNSEWPNTVLHVIHTYIAIVSYCEAFDGSQDMTCTEENATPPWGVDYLVPTRNHLEKSLIALKVSMDELKQRFGQFVIPLYSLSASHQLASNNESEFNHNVSLENMLFVGDRQICYELGLDKQFLTRDSEILIRASQYTLPDKSLWYNRGWITMDFRRRYWADSDRYGQISRSWFDADNHVTLEVGSVFRAQPVLQNNVQCSTEVTFDDCSALCRISLITNLCACAATTWSQLTTESMLTASLPSCTLERYNSCLKFNGVGDSTCISQCLDLCERSTYKFSINAWARYGQISTSVILSMKNFQYPIFEETFEWTFTSFIAALGGIVGLFLGLHFINILNAAFAFLQIMNDKFWHIKLKDQSTTENVENMVIEIRDGQEEVQNAENCSTKCSQLTFRKLLKWLASHAVYIIAVVPFMYLVAQMSIDFVQEYNSNRNVPGMRLALQQNISLPKSTVCLSLHVGELDLQEKDHEHATSRNFTYRYITEKYFNNADLSKETFINGEWPNSLLHVTHTYLVFMTDMEANSETDLINIFSDNRTKSEYFSFEDADLFASQLILEENLRKLNITTYELRLKFGREVNVFFSLTAVQTSGGNNDTNTMAGNNVTKIDIGPTTSVSSHGICYQFSFDQYPFHSQLRQMIVITTSKLSVTLPNSKIYSRMFQVDFTNGNMTGIESNVDKDKDVSTEIPYPVHESISVDTVFSSLPKLVNEKARCSKTVSLDNCMATCRVNLIQDLCHCTATSWSYLATTNQKECTLKDYVTCLNFNATYDSSCRENCVGLCETWNFRLVEKDGSSDNGGRIELQLTKFDYPIFEEQDFWTFDTISAELGNVLGFYLNLDFLTITHIIAAKLALLATTTRLWLQNRYDNQIIVV